MFKKAIRVVFLLILGYSFYSCNIMGGDLKSGVKTHVDITVTFDTKGGNELEPMFIPKDTDIADIEFPIPVREGYTFGKWVDMYGSDLSTASAGRNDKHWEYFYFLTDYSNEITLYAAWKSDNPKLIFDAAGGKFIFEDGSEKDQVVYPYTELKESYTQDTITQFINVKQEQLKTIAKKEHNRFGQWMEPSYSSYDAFIRLQDGYDYIISVVWLPAKELTFVTNGGTELPVYEVETDTFVYSSSVYSNDDFITTKTGYVFAGWYVDAEFTKPFSDMISESMTVFAKWVKKDYTVTKDNLTKTLADLVTAMSYKNTSGFIAEEDVTDFRIDSETFNIKYTGSISADEITELKTALNATAYYNSVFVNLNLSEATNLTDIPTYAFAGCNALRSITIPENTSNILSSAFANCSRLCSVTLSGSLTDIEGQAFYNCLKLSAITIPTGVVSLGSEVFAGCESLKDVTMPDSLITIGQGTFVSCSSLEKIVLPKNLRNIEDSLFSKCEELSDVKIPTSILHIGSNAFEGCKKLKSISIPSNVNQIDSGAFKKCISLETINLSNTSVVNINASTFEGCEKLKSIILSDNVLYIGNRAFADCSALVIQTLPTALTSIGEAAFENCKSITKLVLPAGVDAIGESAFISCLSLSEINIPAKVTLLSKHLFDGCISLTTVTIPSDSKITDIDERAFVGCRSLPSITITAKVETISPRAFMSCASLTEIVFPASVNKIGDNVFEGCSSLQRIEIQGTGTWKYGETIDFEQGEGTTQDVSNPLANVTLFRESKKQNYWKRYY